MRKFCFTILLVTLFLSACNVNSNEKDKDENREAKVIELANELFGALYRIEDPLNYQTEWEAYTNDILEGKESFQGYDKFCYSSSLSTTISWHFLFRAAAEDKNFKVSIENIQLTNYSFEEADGTILNKYDTIYYSYAVELLLEYANGDTETMLEKGGINIKYIQDEWKVYAFGTRDMNQLWTEHLKRK